MDIIEHYKELVRFLGEVLGCHYEIALFDLRNNNNSIVAIANSYISGRKIGSPLTDMVSNLILDGQAPQSSYMLHYQGITVDSRPLLSSSYFIRDEDEIIGVLSLNFDEQYLQDLNIRLFSLFGLEPNIIKVNPERETLWSNTEDVVRHAIGNAKSNNVPPDKLSSREKLAIVAYLKDNGVFRLKGAVRSAAEQLCCSEPTIYRYISLLNNK